MAMKLPTGIYEKALPFCGSWERTLSSAKAAGFDFLEMSIDESGVVPFVDTFRKLAEMKFTGPVMLEMWNDDSPESIRIVQHAREWILDRMAQGNLTRSEDSLVSDVMI